MSAKRVSKKEANPRRTTLNLEEQTVESLIDLVDSIEFLRSFLNDQVVRDVSGIMASVFKLVNAISNTDLVDVLERSLQDPNLDKALIDPPKIGFWGLLSALRDEEVQGGLGIIIELLKAMGRASRT